MPDLPPAAVERGVKAWLRHCSQPGWQSREAAIRREAFAREGVKQVLTAALRLDDPETVERVARAIWDDGRLNDSNAPFDQPWRGMGKSMKEHYRRLARAAISALLGAEPEEAEDDR